MKVNPKILASVTFLTTVFLIGMFYFINSKQLEQEPSDQSQQATTSSENVDYKASFAIYTNGTFRIFTDPKYHNLSEDVYIDSSNPNIVNVKKANTTWNDFFKTLPMQLEKNCLITGTKQTFCTNEEYTLQFYLNGEQNQSALDQVISPGDKLLVTYEKENAATILEQINSVPVN